MRAIVVIILLMLSGLGGCGKKGPLEPPAKDDAPSSTTSS